MSGTDKIYSERYQITSHIARGGMAEVYQARDLLLDRPVALKVLFPELSVDKSFVERFRREAQSAAGLTHPNVVSVYDWGEQDGTYFMVMEYVEGRTLSQVLRQEGALLPDRAADIGADVAAALAFAHRNGVVHRDVKPGNVLISPDGHVKVTDFGIAWAANSDENLTQTGSVMGTATYFSPEQAQGNAVDGRSDVYSLGVVLYEMVVGRVPFTGDNPMAIAYKHVREEPVAPRAINFDVPPAFEAIVLQAMAKSTSDRYSSAEELRADLIRFRQGRPVLARPTVAVVDPGATVAQQRVDRTTALPATSAASAAREERRTSTYVVLLLLMLLILFGLLFALYKALQPSDSGKLVEVPVLLGKTETEARRLLTDVGFDVKSFEEPNDDTEPGRVFSQDPVGGEQYEKGKTVQIKVSTGSAPAPVPDVVGLPYDEADKILREAGFEPFRVDKESTSAPRNEVLSQNPKAGEQRAKGDRVTLETSVGKGDVTVPDLVGDDPDTAQDTLNDLDLRTRQRSAPSTPEQKGKVIATEPVAGTRVEKGSIVTLVVGSGPEQVAVPDV
ncbi:MAG TPA: Stk1 family PASTA domain-containing Ser/Thr kinase, partial [Acidimicrobiales bacterium]|nr:Stk1 family PASTA domain-containing Ser/Thr kinase [Acidimicrobiales bacterium]